MTATLDIAAIRRAVDAMPPAPAPMTIVRHALVPQGQPWKMIDDGHVYYFVNGDDLDSLPLAEPKPMSILPIDFPVRDFDDEMRAVFMRVLDRIASSAPI